MKQTVTAPVSAQRTTSQRNDSSIISSTSIGIGQEEQREEATTATETTDVAEIFSPAEGKVGNDKTLVIDTDNKDEFCGDGYHGPFCGASYWLFRIHGRWKLQRKKEELIGLETMITTDQLLEKWANKGVVLTLPLVLPMATEAEAMVLPKGYLEMDSHVWHPPWKGVGTQIKHWRADAITIGSVDGEKFFGHRRCIVVIERDKRKPPWRTVVAE